MKKMARKLGSSCVYNISLNGLLRNVSFWAPGLIKPKGHPFWAGLIRYLAHWLGPFLGGSTPLPVSNSLKNNINSF